MLIFVSAHLVKFCIYANGIKSQEILAAFFFIFGIHWLAVRDIPTSV